MDQDVGEGQATSERLLEAAALEFNEYGFAGTDTNKIARRAGFAPQTFYRWFGNKEEIFIECYERWRSDLIKGLGALVAEAADDARLVRSLIGNHKRFLIFRRSLRQLAVENDAVRAVRARSRLEQLAFMRTLSGDASRQDAELAAVLLQIERLADAIAEGELRDMSLDEAAAEAALTRLIHELRRPALR